MNQAASWIQKGLLLVAITAVLFVGFAIFVVASIALRLILVGGFVVCALIAGALYYTSPGFRKWFRSVGEPKISYKGLRLGWDVAVYPTHSWTRKVRGGTVVGADDMVQAVLGPVDAVDLPQVGSRVKQGDRLFCLRRGNRHIDVRAPITGTVLTRNESLLREPQLLNQEPFTGGWVARVRPETGSDSQELLQGKEARSWYRREIDRLLAAISADESAITCLPDGGTVVPELYRQIDDNTWNRLAEKFFGLGPQANPRS